MNEIEPGAAAPGGAHLDDDVWPDLPELVVQFDDSDEVEIDLVGSGPAALRPPNTGTADAVADAAEARTGGRSVRAWLPIAAGVVVAAVAMGAVYFLAGSDQAGAPLPNYATNLAAIKAHTGRNTNHDTSPFRQVPQESLDTSDGSPLITTDRSDYVRWGYVGEDYLHQEFAFPVSTGGQFRTACEFSHFAYDDPILFPAQPGAAHLHMFFGNTDINAYSTFETMSDSGGSTCNGAELNRSGYWSPAMIDPDPDAPGGAWVRVPERVVVYYKGEVLANSSNPAAVSGGAQVYRPGMAMVSPQPGVAAVSMSQGGLADPATAEWKCSSNFSPPGQPESVGEIPICSGQTFYQDNGAEWTVLEMEVRFPNCFNTTKADDDWTAWELVGPNDWFVGNCTGELQSGEASAAASSGYEVFPHLEYFVNYRVDPDEDTGDWFLSSDVTSTSGPNHLDLAGQRGSSLHSDWWGAWHPEINQEWIDNCVNFGWNPDDEAHRSGCGFGYLSDGGGDPENPLPGRALARRAEWNGPHKIPLQTLFEELCEPHNPDHGYGQPESGAFCRHPTE